MAGFIAVLRSGSWLTRERLRIVALLLLAFSALAVAAVAVTSDGLHDWRGRPLGTDYSNVYAAGTYVLDGVPAAPFDPRLQYAREQALFGAHTDFFGWHYPPFFLGLAALLALMPYALSLVVWQGVTLALYLLSVRAILSIPPPQGEGGAARSAETGGARPPLNKTPPGSSLCEEPPSPFRGGIRQEWLFLAAGFPGVIICLGQGHNGFLTAALFAAALTQLERRPLFAGVLFGLIAYKPQFGLLLPLVLAASGRWRTFAAAAATVAVLALMVTLAFGVEVWTAFLASTRFTRTVVLEEGQTGWYKIQSVFSWVRMWGGGVDLAYAAQAAVTLAVAASVVWIWRGKAAFPLKAASLLIGTLLATPYSLDYDLMLLAPAIAFMAADGLTRGFAPWEKTILAALWLVPLVARSVPEATLIPLAVPAMLAAFAILLRRAMTESGAFSASGILRRAH
jgi:hypothetical protein